MARLVRPPPKVMRVIAAQTGQLIGSTPGRPGQSRGRTSKSRGRAAPPARTALHESFPLWLLDRECLERLRRDRQQGPVNLRTYLTKTDRWLHQLHEHGHPVGYVHGRSLQRGRHQVVNVSHTPEAALIASAIEQIDESHRDNQVRAGIFECPVVGVAGILLLPKAKQEPIQACLFRNPRAIAHWRPDPPISETALIDVLLGLHVMRAPRAPGAS
jgi:hypothetical protein